MAHSESVPRYFTGRTPGLFGALLLAALVFSPCSLFAQTRTWVNPGSGSWDNELNWSGSDIPDGSSESALLSGTTGYTVGFDLQSIAIDSLTIDNPNVHLALSTDATNSSLAIMNGFINRGTIRLNSDSTLDTTLAVTSGNLTNDGSILFGGSSTSASTLRRLASNLVNNGSIHIDQNASLTKVSGTYTNNNLVQIGAGKSLDFGSTFGTFNQNAGTVDNQGSLTFSSDILNFNGGNFIGSPVTLINSTLNIGFGSNGTGVFNMTRVGTYSGNLAINQVLNINDGVTNSTVSAATGFTNNGMINLNSDSTLDVALAVDGILHNANTIQFGGTSTSASTLRRLSANLVNEGTLQVNQNANLTRTNGVYDNHGTVNIVANKTLEFASTFGTFNQNAGTVNNQGSFVFSNDILNFNGGSFTGNAIALESSTLNIGVGSTGEGTFDMSGVGNYSGDLAADQTLNLRPGVTNSTLTATSGFTNHGVINIDSDSTLDVTLANSDTITNANLIRFGGASTSASTFRRISADLVNNGSIEIDQNARFNKTNGIYTNNGTIDIANGKSLQFDSTFATFNQDAGEFNNAGTFLFSNDILNFNGGKFTGNAVTLDSSTLNIGSGNTGAGVFNMTRVGNYSGDLAAEQILNIVDGISNTSITSASGFENHGTIHINSDSTIDVQLVTNGTLVNQNLVRFGGSSISSSTFRRLSSELENHGTIDIAAEGINTELGINNANHINHGLIISRQSGSVVEWLGDSFVNESTGLLTGLGEFDFSQTGLLNHGTIAAGLSPGSLQIDGSVLLAATSNLDFEIGGTVSGIEHDFLDFLDDVTLGGMLNISLVDGFENSINSSDSFVILNAGMLDGSFVNAATGDSLRLANGQGFFDVNYINNQVVLSNFRVVPEPASCTILMSLSLILSSLRIRNRRA